MSDRDRQGAGNLYEEYKSTSEFVAAVAESERRLAEDKRRLAQMAAWRRYAQRRAEREVKLWAKYRAEQDGPGFPLPMGRRS
jgi:hypothetical protein